MEEELIAEYVEVDSLPPISKNTFAFYDESKNLMQNLEHYALEHKLQAHKKIYSDSLQIIRDESKKESNVLTNFLHDNLDWSKNALKYIIENNENCDVDIPTMPHTKLDLFYKRLELGNSYTKKEYVQRIETMKKAIAKWKLSIIILAGDWMNTMLATADSHYTMTLTDLSARLNNLQQARQHALMNDMTLTQIHSIAGHKFGQIKDDGYGGISNLEVNQYIETQKDMLKVQRKIEETCQIGTRIKNLSLLSDISIDDVQSILLYCMGND